uniref:hypothetical protein n=1 Tax=Salmonella enterica TaxID=28901 RepID=UPI003FA71435
MSHLGLEGLYFALDLLGTVLVSAAATCLAIALWLVPEQRGQAKGPVALFAVLTLAFMLISLYRGTMAPQRTWPIVLAAIHTAADDDRTERIHDLRRHWKPGGMRFVDWYLV